MKNPTQQLRITSPAFLQALLDSERLRIRIVIAAILAAFAIRTARTAILFSHENLNLWVVTTAFIAIVLICEILVLRAVNRAISEGHDLPNAAWIANIVIETCLPALALAFLSSGVPDAAYRPLANPVVLVYFIFIILSTLRLDPVTCRISGAVAAVSYLLAAAYIGWRPMLGTTASVLSPDRAVVGFALTFVVGGFVAGAVAGEIRKQVEAALREAETKRQMERLRHDLEVARSIQQSLLPVGAPEIDGFEIAAWNQPADQTGGDYYDWQVYPDGKLLAVLGDVTGHGIGPALLAAVCRAYVRAVFTPECNMLTAMQRVNGDLARDVGPRRFVTFAALRCAPGDSHVELLSAGHGPMLLYRFGEDRFEEIPAQGLPLGLMPDLGSEPAKVLELSSGDLLIITTDGFFEWANAQDEQFGIERMEAVIRGSREQAPKEIISALYKTVIEFSGGTSQDDDLTALVIKRK
jgi:serine phosphatase RsbU (regulator of sigma subunit)